MSLSDIGSICSIISLLLTILIGANVLKITKNLKQDIKGDGNITSGKNTTIKNKP
jgi:hypothetical protein